MKKTDFKELTEYTVLLESILSHLNIAVAVVSPQLQLLKTNNIFCELFHLPKEATYTSVSDLKGSFWESNNIEDFLRTTYGEQHFNFNEEFIWNTEDGEVRNIIIKSQLLLNEQGTQKKIMLTFSDVTEERENEKGRNQHIRLLMHELRNPLSNISLCVELLSDSVKENDQEEANMFLAKAYNSIQRMKSIINDLNVVRQSV